MMTGFLLRQGARAIATAVLLCTGFTWFVLGERQGLGALVGGGLAGLDFLALVYMVGRLIDRSVPSRQKTFIGLMVALKFLIVGGVFYLVLTTLQVPAAGVMLGIGSAICGFTLGLSSASTSKEGEAMIKAEEARIQAELDKESGDPEKKEG